MVTRPERLRDIESIGAGIRSELKPDIRYGNFNIIDFFLRFKTKNKPIQFQDQDLRYNRGLPNGRHRQVFPFTLMPLGPALEAG